MTVELDGRIRWSFCLEDPFLSNFRTLFNNQRPKFSTFKMPYLGQKLIFFDAFGSHENFDYTILSAWLLPLKFFVRGDT